MFPSPDIKSWNFIVIKLIKMVYKFVTFLLIKNTNPKHSTPHSLTYDSHLIVHDWIPDTTPTFQEEVWKHLTEGFSEMSEETFFFTKDKGMKQLSLGEGSYKATWKSKYVPVTLNIHWKDWRWSWNSDTLTTCYEELTPWKRFWCWER